MRTTGLAYLFVQPVHAQRRVARDHHLLAHGQLLFAQQRVDTALGHQLRHNLELAALGAESHEEQQVLVSEARENGHFVLEVLQHRLVHVVVQDLHRHVFASTSTLVHGCKGPRTETALVVDLDLVVFDLPLRHFAIGGVARVVVVLLGRVQLGYRANQRYLRAQQRGFVYTRV
jgi:hypothetical protein